jgi:nucleoside recognition membrane protein YjiH
MVTKHSMWWPRIIILSAAAAMLVMVSSVGSPLQPAVIFWFLLVCPGMAVTRLLRLKDGIVEITVAIALSIALDALVAEAMVLTAKWSPNWGLTVLAGLSVAGAVLQITTIRGNTALRGER